MNHETYKLVLSTPFGDFDIVATPHGVNPCFSCCLQGTDGCRKVNCCFLDKIDGVKYHLEHHTPYEIGGAS